MQWNGGPVWGLALLTFVLLLPLGLTLRLRRFALTAPGEDRTVVWFGFMRSLRWTLFGSMALWWAATDLIGAQQYTYRISAFLGWRETIIGDVLSLLLVWLPILLILILCAVISQPVYACVRGLSWTRAELAKLSVLRLGMTYVPLLIIIAGARRSFFKDEGIGSYLLCFAGAAGIFLLSLRYLRAATQWTTEALTAGELRDRAFTLAGKLGVRLRQIYVVNAGKTRMANAFASSANTILLTDHLLTQLNRREVDAIVAHELGHLKHHHAKLRGVVTGIVGFGVAFWYSSASTSPFLPLIDIVLAFVPLCALYFLSRKLECTADAEGAKLTGDPEALISGLAKTHSLNLLPVHWGKWNEKLMTHPSTVRRAEAIARSAGLPVERVPKILESALAASGRPADDVSDRYPLPEIILGSAKIFSTKFKRRAYWQGYLAMLAAMTIVPSAAVCGIHAFGWPTQGWIIPCAAFLPAAFLCLIFENFLPFIGYSQIEQQLRDRVEKEGAQPEAWGGVFVGLSPGPIPRAYEANYSWDVGYLFLAGDRLCYWGEETRFALTRDQVVLVRLGPGVPGWLRAPSIYVTWHNAAKGVDETFNLRPAGKHSLRQMSHAVRALARRVEDWRSGEGMLEPARHRLLGFGRPAFGTVTGVAVGRMKLRSLFRWIVIVGFLTGCASSLLGLPVDLATPVARIFRLVGPDGADFWGWYSILSAWLVALFYLAPLLVYRNPVPSSQPRVGSPRPIGECD